MGKITKIYMQQKDKERVNIDMDGQYAFSVDAELVYMYGLKKDMEIEEEKLKSIFLEERKRKALKKALHYLSFKERTKNEVQEYLEKLEYEEEIKKFVIQRLEQYNYINDDLYAKNYIQSKMNQNKSKRYIFEKLKEKKIELEIIHKYLNGEDIEKLEEKNAMDLAYKFLEKGISRYEKEKLKNKMIQNILAKGYGFEITKKSVEKVLEMNQKEIINHEFCVQEENLKNLNKDLEKYKRKYANLSIKEAIFKTSQALYRKGYSKNKIQEVIKKWEDI